jgi:cyclic beta-1,2-glucan synthetase
VGDAHLVEAGVSCESLSPRKFAWFISPAIAYGISLPIRQRPSILSEGNQGWLHLLAKSSRSYFEVCVGPTTNWLPPDNLQEYPEEKLAERIPPTKY